MAFVADLHVHSRFSRATSRDLDLEHLHAWAQRKGIAVVATGDFTHPGWFAELREKLVPAGDGLYRLRDELAAAVEAEVPAACRADVRFVLSVEVSSIYKRGERVRKVHSLLYAPDFETAARIATRLARIGNIESDGRPILGLDARDLLEITLAASPDAFLIPAHIWTPWFSALGEKSGFDSLDDCFRDLTGQVFAAETGLSSDPAMNWRLSALDRLALVSSSDAHSPEKLGREANRFACEPSYFAMRDALRERGPGFLGTIEFFPEEGKYHHEGHRACGVNLAPAEAAALQHLCPRCGKTLTGGVASRVAALADRPEGFRPEGAKPFANLVPLCELLAEILDVGASAARVRACYEKLLARAGSELLILTSLPLADAEHEGPPLLSEALRRVRAGEVRRTAGYDGEYGSVRVFDAEERRRLLSQTRFAFAGETASRRKTAPATLAKKPRRAERRPAPAPTGDDPEQAAAVAHEAGPLLIVAGPGAGKTRTLVGRIARLIEQSGVEPASITAITFTRKAAGELRERLHAAVGGKAEAVWAMTFHALGLSLLRRHPAAAGLPARFRVLDEATRQALVKQVAEQAGLGGKASELASAIARAKADGLPDDLPDELARVLARYEAALAEAGAVDFDDLVLRAVRLLEECPEALAQARARCQHLFVDEYQDINAGQYRLVRRLAATDGQVDLCAVGDPDQAIYGFRGADPAYFGRFAADFPGGRVVALARNYRSAAPIVALAKAVIDKAPARPARPVTALQADGPAVVRHLVADERAEADSIAAAIERAVGGTNMLAMGGGGDGDAGDSEEPRHLAFHDIAVLTRLSTQADAIEEALGRAAIPCQRKGGEALTDRPHVSDLLSRLQRTVDRKGKSRLADAIATLDADANLEPRRQRAVELLCTLALPFGDDLPAFLEAVALWRDADLDLLPQKVSLLTLHAAKGLEFALVFVAGCEDGILPLRLPWLPPADVEEERRLLYVGMTRAKRRLVLLAARKRRLLGRALENRPCPFLDDLPTGLLVDRRDATRARRPRQLSLL
ncbi:MAG: UvrD-helicase domain-containing protein [Deltaproteobacteria bacterium]|nr:UvrD-helicase domain-containing protein [Deltaproteobacteria bacterium]